MRNRYADTIKGIIILLVILGHSIQYGNGQYYLHNGLFFYNPVFKFIYSFHMPIFMLISGYYMGISINRHTTFELIYNKICHLLVPVAAFGLLTEGSITKLLYTINGGMNIYDFGVEYIYLIYMNYHLWFLWSVFFNSIIVIFVSKWFDNPLIYLFIGFFMLFIPNHKLLGVYSFMYPYFIIGYYAYRTNFLNKITITKEKSFTLGILFLICIVFYNKDSYVYTSGQCILNGIYYLLLDIYRFVTGLIGSAFVLCFIYLFYQHFNFSYVFQKLGKNSMELYCFQDLIISWFLIYILPLIPNSNDFNIFTTFLSFLLIVSFSIISTAITKKHKYLNFLLFAKN